MSGRVKSYEAEIESLKSSCAVIDNILSDIKRDYALLDDEHLTLTAHYNHLRELDEKRKGETRAQHRYLTQEELALFTGPSLPGATLVTDEAAPAEDPGTSQSATSTSFAQPKEEFP